MHRRCLYGPINSYHSFLWSNLILCLYNVDTLNICMKEFCSEKIFLWTDKLLPQLFMEQFDILPIQCRHIEHMHEGVLFRKNIFLQNDSCENLDNFSLIRLLYMHRWYLHGQINSYHSF